MSSSLFPAFFRVFQHSDFGLHVHTTPTLGWNDDASAGGHGSFDTWAGSTTDADAMITDFVTILADFYPSTVVFDSYIIYTMDSPTADPEPRTGNTLAVPGTVSGGGWSKAVQATMVWRTVAFGLLKVVLLDCASGNAYDKIATLPGSGPIFDLDALLVDNTKGFSGQDNAQPGTFIGQTKTLNEKLRREYRMT